MMLKPADEWMTFALRDLEDGEWLFSGNRFNNACFHAQQATEKALKGFIVDSKISHPKTHDLIDLNKICVKIDSEFTLLRETLTTLNQFYKPLRYPDAAIGMSPKGMPSKDDTREALDFARDVFDFCSEKIRQTVQQKPPEPQPRYYEPPDRNDNDRDDR